MKKTFFAIISFLLALTVNAQEWVGVIICSSHLQWVFAEASRHFRLFQRRRFLLQQPGDGVRSACMSSEVSFLDLRQQRSDLCVREDERMLILCVNDRLSK